MREHNAFQYPSSEHSSAKTAQQVTDIAAWMPLVLLHWRERGNHHHIVTETDLLTSQRVSPLPTFKDWGLTSLPPGLYSKPELNIISHPGKHSKIIRFCRKELTVLIWSALGTWQTHLTPNFWLSLYMAKWTFYKYTVNSIQLCVFWIGKKRQTETMIHFYYQASTPDLPFICFGL